MVLTASLHAGLTADKPWALYDAAKRNDVVKMQVKTYSRLSQQAGQQHTLHAMQRLHTGSALVSRFSHI